MGGISSAVEASMENEPVTIAIDVEGMTATPFGLDDPAAVPGFHEDGGQGATE